MIYKCAYCGNEFDTISGAQACEKVCQEAAEKRADEAAAENRKQSIKVDEIKKGIDSKIAAINDYNVLIEDCYAEIESFEKEIKNAQEEKYCLLDELRELDLELRSLMPNHKVIITEKNGKLSYSIEEVKNFNSEVVTEKMDKALHDFGKNTIFSEDAANNFIQVLKKMLR